MNAITFEELLEKGRLELAAEREAQEAAQREAKDALQKRLSYQVVRVANTLLRIGFPGDAVSAAIKDSIYAREDSMGIQRSVAIEIAGFAPITVALVIWEEGNMWHGRMDAFSVWGEPYLLDCGNQTPEFRVEWGKSNTFGRDQLAYGLALAEENGRKHGELLEEAKRRNAGLEAEAELYRHSE